MRLIVTSDLHLGLTKAPVIAAMVERMRADEPDAVVLAGDLAHGLDNFAACVALFQGLPTYVLAGNHDVWRDKQRGIDSETLWTQALPEACRKLNAVWLEDASATFGDVGLVGSMCWYDYSGGEGVTLEQCARLKPHISNDAHWIDWKRGDIGFARELEDKLLQRIAAHPAPRLAVVTHVPILEEQMHRKPGDRAWGAGNAYFGNLTTGARVLREPRVKAIVSGHTHWGVDTRVGDRVVRVVGSDYGIPNYTRVDL